MIKGALGIVGLAAVVWAVGCGTHSGIGNLGMGGNGGEGAGMGGDLGLGGFGIGTGGQGAGGFMGTGGQGMGGRGGEGAGGFMGQGAGGFMGIGSCPGLMPPLSAAKTLAFAAPVDYPIGNGVVGVATGDLNGDGKLDLVLLDRTLGVRLMLNTGGGTFAATVNLGLAGPTALAVGDLDGDGKPDIVDVSASAVSVFLNKGNATFEPPVNYVVGNGSEALALGDLNGDGKLDIAVVDGGDGSSTSVPDVGILLNTGSGTFMPANYPAGRQPFAIAIGDLDNDCQPDLMLTQPTGVTALFNRFGTFPIATNFANGTAGQSVAVADLNGDGKLDVVEGPGASSDDGRTYVLLNRADESFNAPIVYSVSATITSMGPSSGGGNLVALADMNGDGRPDLLTLASCCGLGVFLNRGDGTFPAPVTFPLPASPSWLTAGDLNGDGQPDVAVVSGSGLRVLINSSH